MVEFLSAPTEVQKRLQPTVEAAQQHLISQHARQYSGDIETPRGALDYARHIAHGLALVGKPATAQEVKSISDWAGTIREEGLENALKRIHAGDLDGAIDEFNRFGKEQIDRDSVIDFREVVSSVGGRPMRTFEATIQMPDGKQRVFNGWADMVTAMTVSEQAKLLNDHELNSAKADKERAYQDAASALADQRRTSAQIEWEEAQQSRRAQGEGGEAQQVDAAPAKFDRYKIQETRENIETLYQQADFEESAGDEERARWLRDQARAAERQLVAMQEQIYQAPGNDSGWSLEDIDRMISRRLAPQSGEADPGAKEEGRQPDQAGDKAPNLASAISAEEQPDRGGSPSLWFQDAEQIINQGSFQAPLRTSGRVGFQSPFVTPSDKAAALAEHIEKHASVMSGAERRRLAEMIEGWGELSQANVAHTRKLKRLVEEKLLSD